MAPYLTGLSILAFATFVIVLMWLAFRDRTPPVRSHRNFGLEPRDPVRIPFESGKIYVAQRRDSPDRVRVSERDSEEPKNFGVRKTPPTGHPDHTN